jgi:L-cystine transport system substrate-binding protein
MKIRWMAVLVAVALTGAASAKAQDFKAALVASDTITIGTSGSAPPFSMTNATGQLEGFDIDVMNLVAEKLGTKTRFAQLDFAGLLPGLAAGRFDVISSGLTRTPERLASKDFFLLSPYIVNGTAITRRTADSAITGWSTVCGKVMGAVRGGSFQKIAQESLRPGCVTESREYPGTTELLLDLNNRRIDFAAHDFLGPNYLVKSGKASGIAVLPDVIATVTQSAAVSARNKPLADRIDALFADWRKDGTLDRVAQKWFGTSIDWSKAN